MSKLLNLLVLGIVLISTVFAVEETVTPGWEVTVNSVLLEPEIAEYGADVNVGAKITIDKNFGVPGAAGSPEVTFTVYVDNKEVYAETRDDLYTATHSVWLTNITKRNGAEEVKIHVLVKDAKGNENWDYNFKTLSTKSIEQLIEEKFKVDIKEISIKPEKPEFGEDVTVTTKLLLDGTPGYLKDGKLKTELFIDGVLKKAVVAPLEIGRIEEGITFEKDWKTSKKLTVKASIMDDQNVVTQDREDFDFITADIRTYAVYLNVLEKESQIRIGEPMKLLVEVKNTGTVKDNWYIDVEPEGGWVFLDKKYVELSPSEVTNLILYVNPINEYQIGNHTITVKTRSSHSYDKDSFNLDVLAANAPLRKIRIVSAWGFDLEQGEKSAAWIRVQNFLNKDLYSVTPHILGINEAALEVSPINIPAGEARDIKIIMDVPMSEKPQEKKITISVTAGDLSDSMQKSIVIRKRSPRLKFVEVVPIIKEGEIDMTVSVQNPSTDPVENVSFILVNLPSDWSYSYLPISLISAGATESTELRITKGETEINGTVGLVVKTAKDKQDFEFDTKHWQLQEVARGTYSSGFLTLAATNIDKMLKNYFIWLMIGMAIVAFFGAYAWKNWIPDLSEYYDKRRAAREATEFKPVPEEDEEKIEEDDIKTFYI